MVRLDICLISKYPGGIGRNSCCYCDPWVSNWISLSGTRCGIAAEMASGSVYAETLKSITQAKLLEISRRREVFERNYKVLIRGLGDEPDSLTRLNNLIQYAKACFPTSWPASSDFQSDLANAKRVSLLANYDCGMLATGGDDGQLVRWAQSLQGHLDLRKTRLEFAALYGDLVTEWLESADFQSAKKLHVEQAATGADFEDVPSHKRLAAREAFESEAFKSKNVNPQMLDAYLHVLFDNDDEDGKIAKATGTLRKQIASFEKNFHDSREGKITDAAVTFAIEALLQSDLPTPEQRPVFSDLLKNPVMISEIRDVLSMRLSSLWIWDWESTVTVDQRRNANGTFDFSMNEDIVQAIFLQHIGTAWAVRFKQAFECFRRSAWKSNFPRVPLADRKRLQYFLGEQDTEKSLHRKRRRNYRRNYFVYMLPDTTEQVVTVGQGREEAEPQAPAESQLGRSSAVGALRCRRILPPH